MPLLLLGKCLGEELKVAPRGDQMSLELSTAQAPRARSPTTVAHHLIHQAFALASLTVQLFDVWVLPVEAGLSKLLLMGMKPYPAPPLAFALAPFSK